MSRLPSCHALGQCDPCSRRGINEPDCRHEIDDWGKADELDLALIKIARLEAECAELRAQLEAIREGQEQQGCEDVPDDPYWGAP